MKYRTTLAALSAAWLGATMLAPTLHAQTAPGAPGVSQGWASADKHGFGTARAVASKIWFTLGASGPTEMFYPRLDTPAIRDLRLVVSDGATFADHEAEAMTTRTAFDPATLQYRQTSTANSGKYRIVKTYAADPARAVMLVDIAFTSLDGRKYQLYALLNPGLNNSLVNTSGQTQGRTLLASNGDVASAFVAFPAFTKVSNGYLGASDGWMDLSAHKRMTWAYMSAPNGDVVQTGQTALDGVSQTHVTLAVGFSDAAEAALGAAQKSLASGFDTVAAAYGAGWSGYLGRIKAAPATLSAPEQALYKVSAQILASSEDKTYPGAFLASPTMPWAFGTGLDNPSDAYHLVWARDLYQIATAMLAEGDRAAATRAVQYLFNTQQKADGSFPQNSRVDGTPVWGGLQMDEVGFPIVLAWQLQQFDATFYANHIKPAANFIAHNGPWTQGERWENQSGFSPATIAAEIAGLVCAADIASRNGDSASANLWLSVADWWQQSVAGWTATSNGPFSTQQYYLRLTKDQQPNNATTYNIGDSGPDNFDQRAVVDPSFLDLVRLGVKQANDPVILNTIKVVDAQLAGVTPNGTFWHRYNGDGYGEQADGSMWTVGFPAGSQATRGRLWPIFAGERGEYELAAGLRASAATRLANMAATANDGGLIPEQVWDSAAPGGRNGFAVGTATTSAAPLAWSHAQYVRLLWSVAHGRPVETPTIVACRYAGRCGS